MDKDGLCQKLKKDHNRLRWAGLTSAPDYVQLCYENVESNAERIEKVLKYVSELKHLYEFLASHKEVYFSHTTEDSWQKSLEFQQSMREAMCHFCECLDAQSNFLLMIKNALISQNNAENALVYRHIQVELVRTFQKLNFIDKYIRENDRIFHVEAERRVSNKLKDEISNKYGIDRGSLRNARNKIAAHWDDDVDYIDLYERSKKVNNIQIYEICMDMYNLTQSYSNCITDGLSNYIKSLRSSIKQVEQ